MIVELPGLPGVGRDVLRAALPRSRPTAASGLPDVEVGVRGVMQPRDRLAAYDRLCGLALRDAVSATWLHVLAFPLQAWLMARPDFPFALAGIRHVTNEMRLLEPVVAGDRLDLRVRAAALRPHRRGVVFDLVSEAAVDGREVWQGTSTYLSARGSVPGEPAPPLRLELPDAPVAQQWRLPADLGRRYAAVSGDTNPIHLHPLTARAFGLRRPIIHGMWTHARALAALGGVLPERYAVRVQFAKPLELPGRAGFAAAPDAGGSRFAVLNREGKPHLVGELRPL